MRPDCCRPGQLQLPQTAGLPRELGGAGLLHHGLQARGGQLGGGGEAEHPGARGVGPHQEGRGGGGGHAGDLRDVREAGQRRLGDDQRPDGGERLHGL